VILAFTMLTALAGDLFLLPALLRLVRVRPAGHITRSDANSRL
jgi:hypothetical protein